MRSLKLPSVLSCAVLALGAVAVAFPQAAQASPQSPNSCAPDPTMHVVTTRVYYSSEGPAAGKHNTSPYTETLNVTLSQTASRSSTWEGGASATVDFGIAQVEASTNYSVTKTTTTGKTVTDQVVVPSGYYGYAQAAAEYRTFHIYRTQTTPSCGTSTTDYGYFDGIVTTPFFLECVGKTQCTPH